MRDHRPTATTELIDSSLLKRLQDHASEIININKVIKSIVPASAVDHVRAANVRNGQLVIETASAALKMRIDRDRLNILNQLRSQGFAKLISIEVKINPAIYRNGGAIHQSKKEAKTRPPISQEAANYLLAVAESAPPKLQARLQRLATLTQTPNKPNE
ncbi:DUF721 domain-containing protein [Vibrio palustris]|uniref:DUF721 domain-containing protein n=1 Tax=Vibrio palustris TaxID=1918946 RepID=A0A1R4AZS0_9VIBR|nr:DciA family protein [Vibrio palustris]SJL82137.1 hypothetical protein VPAL9027_00047 [Vibrio palustris]